MRGIGIGRSAQFGQLAEQAAAVVAAEQAMFQKMGGSGRNLPGLPAIAKMLCGSSHKGRLLQQNAWRNRAWAGP